MLQINIVRRYSMLENVILIGNLLVSLYMEMLNEQRNLHKRA